MANAIQQSDEPSKDGALADVPSVIITINHKTPELTQ